MEYNLATVIVGVSGTFCLGMSFALLGSLAVKLMPRMDIDQARFGSLVATLMFSCLLSTLAMGALVDQLGYRAVAVLGFVITPACVFALARARRFRSGLLACAALGVGAMACNTTGNVFGTSVVQSALGVSAAAANNLVNVFFAFGLFLTPFLMSVLFQRTSYERAVSAVGCVLLLPLAFALVAVYPSIETGFSLRQVGGFLREPAAVVGALMLFLYIALDGSLANWLAPYGKEVVASEHPGYAIDRMDALAARLLSVFALSTMAGRLLAGFSGVTRLEAWLVAGVALAAVGPLVWMTRTASTGVAYGLTALVGLLLAPVFPGTLGVVFEKMGGGSGSLFGLLSAVGVAGAVVVPKVIGNRARGSSVQKALGLLIPVCLVLAALALVLQHLPARLDMP
jgi:fucose permease